jgi:hypothetical protein
MIAWSCRYTKKQRGLKMLSLAKRVPPMHVVPRRELKARRTCQIHDIEHGGWL